MLAYLRRAVTDYRMIRSGDRIAVGISGGKDSLTLLTLLKAYQRFSPETFELTAVTIDMGFEEDAFREIKQYCDQLNVPYRIVKTDIAKILFEERKEKNPCSLCSKMRRGALNRAIMELGYNKLALGHHSDDVLETFLLSFFYEGRLNTFAPVSYMSRSGVTLIRPLIYTEEKDIRAYAKDLPVYRNPCPKDHHTQREYMKQLLKEIQKEIPFAKERACGAIMHPERYHLWDGIAEKENDE